MKRPRQIVVCGCSRGGTTLLYSMLRTCIAGAKCPPEERSALKHRFDRAPLIITKSPMDVLSAVSINRTLGWLKTVEFIFVVRDPRALISSHHIGARGQFFQGFDYQMWVGKRASGYVKPGLLAVFQAIESAIATRGLRHVVVRYEDLVRDPNAVQSYLSEALSLDMNGQFSDFHTREIPKALRGPLNGVRPVDGRGANSWRIGERLHRVVAQFRQAPELFDLLERWGYEKDRRWFDEAAAAIRAVEPRRGTILSVAPPGVKPEVKEDPAVQVFRVEDPQLKAYGDAARVRCLARERASRTGPLLCVMPQSTVHEDPWPALQEVRSDCAAFVDSRGYLHDETLYLDDTPGASVVLDEWARAVGQQPRSHPAELLHRIVLGEQQAPTPRFTFHHLPVNLCWSRFLNEPYTYGPILIEHRCPMRPQRVVDRLMERLGVQAPLGSSL